MINNHEDKLPRTVKWGWGVLLTLSALLALNGVTLYFFIADSHLMRTASLLELGLGLFALGVAWEGFRRGSRWAWKIFWILVTLLAILGIHILVGGELGVSLWYLSLAVVALVGQLLAGRNVLYLFVLIITAFAVTSPVTAMPERGRVLQANLTGVSTVQQEDGATYTIDYEGTLRAGLFREQIVLDITQAGVIRETGESVVITNRRVGVFQREGNRILFDTCGQIRLERENGSSVVFDPTGCFGVIQQNGRNIVIDIIDAGVVDATGENVLIHTTGAGELQYSGDIGDGTDI